MWEIYEHRRVAKQLEALPIEILKRYEKWKDIVSISGPEGLRSIVGFHFTQVIAKLIETVSLFGDPETLEQGLMNIPGTESTNRCAGIDEYFHQANHAGVVDFDAGDAGRTLLDRMSQTFQE